MAKVITVLGKPAHHLVAVIDPETWSYHFADDPSNPALTCERINQELAPIGVKMEPVLPTIAEIGAEFEPQVTPHRYTAHDSGFMAFAVETTIQGEIQAVTADGKPLAVMTPAGADNADPRAILHALIDLVFDNHPEWADEDIEP